MNTRFVFTGEWPPEAAAAASEALSDLEWLVPDWCPSVTLRWQVLSGDRQAVMSNDTDPTYRLAVVYFHPAFLSEPVRDRRHSAIHELLHVFVGPLALAAENLADRLLKEEAPKFHDQARADITHWHESAVQDLATVLLRRLESR